MEAIDVKILGRDFKIACKPEEKMALLQAVNIVEMKMSAIRDTGKVVGMDKIAVMAALQIAHDSISGDNPNGSALGLDLESLERKIEAIDTLASQAIKKPESAQTGQLF